MKFHWGMTFFPIVSTMSLISNEYHDSKLLQFPKFYQSRITNLETGHNQQSSAFLQLKIKVPNIALGLKQEADSKIETKVEMLQAGGHQGRFKLNEFDPTQIVKKTWKDEADFYQYMVPKLDRANGAPWDGWRSDFFWQEECEMRKNRKQSHLCLGNLAPTIKNSKGFFFSHPIVIDIKLGQTLYGAKTKPKTIRRKKLLAHTTTSGKFGLRLTGAQLWDNARKKYTAISKAYGFEADCTGKNLQEKFNFMFPICERVPDLEIYDDKLSYSPGGLPRAFLHRIIKDSIIPHLNRLLIHVSKMNCRLFNSSLLVIFEGDKERLESEKNKLDGGSIFDHVAVRLVDFAHASMAESPHQSLILGLQETMKLFQKLSKTLEKYL